MILIFILGSKNSSKEAQRIHFYLEFAGGLPVAIPLLKNAIELPFLMWHCHNSLNYIYQCLKQEWYSEFGSFKERKKNCWQGF